MAMNLDLKGGVGYGWHGVNLLDSPLDRLCVENNRKDRRKNGRISAANAPAIKLLGDESMSEAGQLIKLESGDLTMSSEQLAIVLEIEHSELRKKANAMAKKGLIEFREESSHNPDGGRPRMVMHFDKRNSMVIAARLNERLLTAVVDRWLELEGRVPVPRELTRLELLQVAIDSEQKRIAAESALALAAPKIEFVERYVEAETGSMGFRQVAKLLGVKENVFREFLLEKRIMYRLGGVLTAYAEHIDADRFEVKTGVANEHAYQTSKFTAKGVQWIADKYRKAAV